MSKGLEALKEIKEDAQKGFFSKEDWERTDIIKKELKALEIIKKKDVDIGLLREETLESYNDIIRERYNNTETELTLTQEEYELLNEVLL